jgi:hypothetical protein
LPKLTETCILGIDFITKNYVIGKTRQLSYLLDNKRITLEDKIEKISQYKVTLKGMKMAMNETDPSNKIEDPNVEIHRKNIAKIIEKFKDIKRTQLSSQSPPKFYSKSSRRHYNLWNHKPKHKST